MSIALTNSTEPVSIEADHVYFAFPSGRFSYDCISCGAKCCHGHGFEVLAGRELRAQLATSHAVRFFLDPCEAGTANHYHARNLKPGCFFLTEQNFCGIQVKDGYDVKPETCRLFPFNQISRAGDFLIVAPHSGLCPLAILPPDQRSDASNHEQLLAMMSSTGVGTHIPDMDLESGDVPVRVAIERSVVSLSEQALPARYATNAGSQLALTRLAGALDDPDGAVANGAREEIERYQQILYEVLGATIPNGCDDRALVSTMVGMTPSIRARLVFHQEAAGGRAGLERVPFLLLALHALASFALEAGMAAVTYQTVMSLFDLYRPLLKLLADSDRVMVWKADVAVDFAATSQKPLQSAYVAVAKALMPAAQRVARAPLGKILCEHAVSGDFDRVLLLKLLARRLDGRLVALEDAESAGSRLRHPRASAQQWAIRHLSPDVLTLIAERQLKRSSRS